MDGRTLPSMCFWPTAICYPSLSSYIHIHIYLYIDETPLMNASCIEGTGLGQLVARNRLPINIGNRNVVHHKLSLSSFNISFKRHSFFLVMDVWFCKTCMAWILDVDIVFPRQWCWSCQCMTTSYRHWQSSSLMGTEKGRTETRSLSLKRINSIV